VSNVKKLHNKKLYRVELNLTTKYVLYLEANSYKDLDREVSSVVNSDMYTLATDQKPGHTILNGNVLIILRFVRILGFFALPLLFCIYP